MAMERKNIGRVVGVIHGRRVPPNGTPLRLAFYPQRLRLVARPDKDTERMIENGLALSALRGHTAAIDYLVGVNVPLSTISRVLWNPLQRRTSGG
jgi:hypothetical protein